MAAQLEMKPSELDNGNSDVRNLVKYVCAPAGSGKTSSILPAFLQSEFTHYLYIAFANSNNCKFSLTPSAPFDDQEKAYNQGAAFALACVNMLLMKTKLQAISILPTELISQEAATKRLKAMIRKHFGALSHVLFHVDEHRKMCDRSDREHDPGASFSRGAMQTLAGAGTVVATYTEPPYMPAIGAEASSEVCRLPVALPCLDVDKVLQHVGIELPRGTNAENERLLALLKLRIQIALQPGPGLGMGGLHRIDSSPQHKEMFDNFRRRLSQTTMNQRKLNRERKTNQQKTILQECITACPTPRFDNVINDKHAALLLRGMSDDQLKKAGRGLTHLIVLPNGRISTTLLRLLTFQDEDSELRAIYAQGQQRFRRAILNSADTLSGQPLEEAYLWTLSCQSVSVGKLVFTDIKRNVMTFDFKCTSIKSSRIFPSDDTTNFDISHLQHNTMYYANELKRGGTVPQTHPLADMFFRTKNDHLVLIDVKGANLDAVNKKVKHLARTISNMQTGLGAKGG